MKKQLMTAILTGITLFSIGQNFYKSIDDFKAGKPIKGVKVIDGSWRYNFFKESLELERNKKSDRVKVSEFPSEYFTYQNHLMRVFEKEIYYVLVEGKYCFYTKKMECELSGEFPDFSVQHFENKDANGVDIGKVRHYFSTGIKGEIESFKEKTFKKILKEKELEAQFEADEPKREFKDSKDDYISKEINWFAKYFDLLNT